MGKHRHEPSEKNRTAEWHRHKTDTKVLYKKSNATLRTHSKTCSDATHMARCGLMQLKKTLSKTKDYYTDGDKVKRDLSVETGFCVLRRYYKSKHRRDKCSIPPSTAKSRCSTVADTVLDSIDEFKCNMSGCGDSRNKFEIVNQINPASIDITALMVENLKGLLNEWIRKHVLEDRETKEKLANVLDCIINSIETKISNSRSSCSTYIVERNGEGYKVSNKKTATNSITCQYCKQKQTSLIRSSSILFREYSRSTIPLPYRHMRIISTLSIPRNIHKKEKTQKKNMVYKLKRIPKNNVFFCNDKKERKVVINVSSCETTSASKKKFTIKCSNTNERIAQMKKKGVVFYKGTSEYTSTTDVVEANTNTEDRKHVHLDAMPSLVKSIYADDPANITSTDKIKTQQNNNDKLTMTEVSHLTIKVGHGASNAQFHETTYECCERNTKSHKSYENHSKFSYINQSVEFPNVTVPTQNLCMGCRKNIAGQSQVPKTATKYSNVSRNGSSLRRKRDPCLKHENIKSKRYTNLYKKTKSKRQQEMEFLNNFRKVIKYFANNEGNRNIKFEIYFNVHPLFDVKKKKSHVDNRETLNYKDKTPADICNMENIEVNMKSEEKSNNLSKEAKVNPEIIPLLDGAVSQAKYIFKSDNSSCKSEDTVESTHRSTMMTDLKVPRKLDNFASKCIDSMQFIASKNQGTVMTSLEISKELNELKTAIRDLSATAAMMVTEHLQRKAFENTSKKFTKHTATPKPAIDLENTNVTLSKRSTESKGIQISNTKGELLSGLKLSKGPKRVEEFTNRLKKRSSSYHVIDSETILKVTNMSSFVATPKQVPEPQLKKSKSLLHFTTEAHKQRLVAFFCESGRKDDNIVYNLATPQRDSLIPTHCPNRILTSEKLYIPVKVSQESYEGCGHEYCSSAFKDVEKPTITVKPKNGLPFWEGCLYCILLWIPLCVIMYFFYDYVLKDLITKPTPSNGTKRFATTRLPRHSSESGSSRLLLKLSDFGF